MVVNILSDNIFIKAIENIIFKYRTFYPFHGLNFRILFFDYLYFIPIVAQKNNMKKLYSKLVLFVFTCFFISEVQAQTVVTIPPANAAQTGTVSANTYRKPLGTNRSYERSAMKYTQAEIGTLGNITAVAFYCDTVNVPGKVPLKIYIKEVSDSTFVGSTVAAEETNAMLVYADTLQPAVFIKNTWITIPLKTVFPHLNKANIEVIVETNSGGTTGTDVNALSKGFRYFPTTGSNRFEYWQSAPTSSVVPTNNGTLSLNRPNIQLTITAAAACTSPPTPGTASTNSTTVCSGAKVNLSLTGNSTGTGQTLQWESSPNGTTWTPIAGATLPYYTAIVTADTYYHCVVTCSTVSASSTTVHVTLNPFYQCYCTPVSNCSVTPTAIDSVAIKGTTLKNGLTGCSTGGYTSYPATGNTTASLTQGQVYTLNTKFTGNVKASAWIDFNHSGTFDPSEWKQVCTTSIAGANVTSYVYVPFTALSGLTAMRIRARSNTSTNDSTSACSGGGGGNGEIEDYLITITAAAACASPPAAGTATATTTLLCAGGTTNLVLTGNNSGTGTTLQWQSSTNGTTWTPIAGATQPIYTATVTVDSYFQCVVTCGGSSATSTPVHVTLNPFYQCYCTSAIGGNCATTGAIDSVAIENTTLNNGPTGCSTNNYASYPLAGVTTATLTAGHTYMVHTRYSGTGAAKSNSSLWIDYNHNGVFDVNEFTRLTDSSNALIDVMTPVTIPVTASTGVTGMRIRSRSTAGANIDSASCWQFGSGETEDYLITIAAYDAAVNELSQLSDVHIYPNPTSGNLYLNLNLINYSKLNYQIINMTGELVYSEQTGICKGIVKKTFNLTNFSKGVYYIRVGSDKDVIIKKVIVL